jgi:hypothetical protein
VYIANSQFTADRYRQEFGIDSTVIPPIFRPELYRTTSTRKYVTFINPDPRKGRDLAFAIAEHCPRVPFSFVEAWALKADEKERLRQRIGLTPNVTFKPRTSDMREVYGETRILLVPSQWEEAWGAGRIGSALQRHTGGGDASRRPCRIRWRWWPAH